jgi:hypothetical protein
MWILALLPDWFWHILTLAGVVAVFAAWVLKRIPFVSQYNLILKIAGTAAVCLGLWMEGGIANEAKWQAKVAEMEAKVKEAETKSKETNVQIQKVYVDRVKKVKEVQVVIQERIKEVEKRIDAECKVAPEAISILNDAAKNRGTVVITGEKIK